MTSIVRQRNNKPLDSVVKKIGFYKLNRSDKD